MGVKEDRQFSNLTTQRQKTYLERLKSSKGRRVVVDLGPELAEGLDRLIASGYGRSQVEVIRKALTEACDGVSRECDCASEIEAALREAIALERAAYVLRLRERAADFKTPEACGELVDEVLAQTYKPVGLP